MIDIIIPTMWVPDTLLTSLESYANHQQISRIILVDNNHTHRPQHQILQHPKVNILCYNKNLYVNPAWNEGVSAATATLVAIINDDIHVDGSVFDMVVDFGLKPGELVGVNLRGRQNNYKIDAVINTHEEIVSLNYDPKQPIGGQAWAFGICLFLHRQSYTPIPSLYQVWYGDDYLAQRATKVYAINSNKIKGHISQTLVKYGDTNSDISQRILLDSQNLLRFDHFENGKHWDIPQNIVNKHQTPTDLLQAQYRWATTNPSDINQNVHVLYELAQQCDTVVEFGVRTGVSTRAFLASNVQLLSFDVVLDPGVQRLFEYARGNGKNVQYIQANVLDIEIDPTDLLFIDTLHTYEQLSQELQLHGNKAKKYLVFHDTHTFGLRGETPQDHRGLLPAIIEFVIKNPHWQFKLHHTNNNGLTVLERQ